MHRSFELANQEYVFHIATSTYLRKEVVGETMK